MSITPLSFKAGGTLAETHFYIEREADETMPAALLRGEFCYVLAPRQMGKSSLRYRIARRLSEQHGVRCATVDLTRLGGSTTTAAEWYFGIVDEIARQLGDESLRSATEDFWVEHDKLPVVQRFSLFVRDLLLVRISGQLVVFVDEIDAVRALPFNSDDFFAAVRALYNARPDDHEYERLSVCLLGVAQPSDLIRNERITPFNIGTRIDLADFERFQLTALRDGLLSTGANPDALLHAIYHWTHGHPYMVQSLCAVLVPGSGNPPLITSGHEADYIAALVERIFLRRNEGRDSNLAYAEKTFQRGDHDTRVAKMLALYARLVRGESIPGEGRDPIQGALQLTGMVAVRATATGHRLEIRNHIFATVFDASWVRAQQAERTLTEPLARWLDSQRSDDFVLRGEALREAEKWDEGRIDITSEEQEFLRACWRVRGAEEHARAETAVREFRSAQAEAEAAKVRAAQERLEREKAQAQADADRAERENAQAQAELEKALKERAQALAAAEKAEREKAQARIEAERAERAEIALQRQAEQTERETAQRLARRTLAAALALASAFLIAAGLGLLAYRNALEARKQATIARQRLDDAVSIVEQVVFVVDQRLSRIPGTASARKELLSEAIGFLDQLHSQTNASADKELLHTRAAAYLQRGDLAMTYDNVTVAAREYRAALETYEALVARQPNDMSAQRQLSLIFVKRGEVDTKMGQLSEAQNWFERSLKLREKLADANPKDAQVQRDLSVSLEKLGSVAVQMGQLAEAKVFFERSINLSSRLAADDPQDTQTRRDLSISLEKLGSVAVQMGQLDEAKAFLERGLHLSERLAIDDPSNASLQSDLSVSCNQLGRLARAQGDLAKAESWFKKSLELREKLAMADPSNASLQRDLSVSYNQLGHLSQEQGNLAKAESWFKKSLELREKLAMADPSNAFLRSDLSVSYNHLGDVSKEQGDLAKAESWFKRSLELREKLAVADPSNASLQSDLSVTYNQLGEVSQAKGDLAKVESWFKKSLELREKLAIADPSNASLQSDLSVSYNQLGRLSQAKGDLAKAESWFKKSLALQEKLAKADPSNASLQRDISVTYERLGDRWKRQGDLAKAESWFKKSLELTEKLAKSDPSNALLQRDLLLTHVMFILLGDAHREPGSLLSHVRAAEEILGRFHREGLFVGDPQLAQIRALVDRAKRKLR